MKVSSTNKTERHDIIEILLKVALNTIDQTNRKWNSYLEKIHNELFVHMNDIQHEMFLLRVRHLYIIVNIWTVSQGNFHIKLNKSNNINLLY